MGLEIAEKGRATQLLRLGHLSLWSFPCIKVARALAAHRDGNSGCNSWRAALLDL